MKNSVNDAPVGLPSSPSEQEGVVASTRKEAQESLELPTIFNAAFGPSNRGRLSAKKAPDGSRVIVEINIPPIEPAHLEFNFSTEELLDPLSVFDVIKRQIIEDYMGDFNRKKHDSTQDFDFVNEYVQEESRVQIDSSEKENISLSKDNFRSLIALSNEICGSNDKSWGDDWLKKAYDQRGYHQPSEDWTNTDGSWTFKPKLNQK